MSEISLTYSKFGNSIMHKLHNHKFQPTENSTVMLTSIHEAIHIRVFAFLRCVQASPRFYVGRFLFCANTLFCNSRVLHQIARTYEIANTKFLVSYSSQWSEK